jgi:hypothetical protein
MVTLAWSLGGTNDGPSSFVIDVGSGPGLTDLAMLGIDGLLRGLSVAAPSGTYYVRLRSVNGCGTSGPSNEIVVSVP